MYQKFFGFNKKAFDLAPDPTMVFMSETHQEAMAIFRYGVLGRKGFLMLTGQVGSGKTTLLQLLVESYLNTRVHLCLIANPTLTPNEFYYLLNAKYNLGEFDGNKAKFLVCFSNFLHQCRKKAEQVLLVIDEAHVLPEDILEEIRLLSNQDYQEYGVLSIFLVGQPELQSRLSTDRLLPLKQRIGIQFNLKPFTPEETEQYIHFRLRKAGCINSGLFTKSAIQLIHGSCNGTPRLINVLCDHALLTGYSEGKLTIDEKIVRECLKELDIAGKTSNIETNRFSLLLNIGWPFTVAAWVMIIILIIAILYKVFHNPETGQVLNVWKSVIFK